MKKIKALSLICLAGLFSAAVNAATLSELAKEGYEVKSSHTAKNGNEVIILQKGTNIKRCEKKHAWEWSCSIT